MKRTFPAIFALTILFTVYSFLHSSSQSKNKLLNFLNQDTLYLIDGSIVQGWIWDDKGGLVLGETAQGEIFVFNSDEYKRIERNKFLSILRRLI